MFLRIQWIEKRCQRSSIFRSIGFSVAVCGFASCAFGIELPVAPSTQEQLIERFGNPIGYIRVGERRILQYPHHLYWVEGNRIVRSMKQGIDNDRLAGTTELIVNNPAIVNGPDPIGIPSVEDAYIRGGRFSNVNHESVNDSVLSLSGVNEYVPLNADGETTEAAQMQIRKAYLSFKVGDLSQTNGVLILHTAKPWLFEERQWSPTLHVFALIPESIQNSDDSITDWHENRLDWESAEGNCRFNGMDLSRAVRLASENFPRSESFGLSANQVLRFELGDISRYVTSDDRITLILTQSSGDRLDVYSKEGTGSEWLCPRLVLR